MPLFTLRVAPHGEPRKTRGRADRYSLLVRLLPPLLPTGLSRRTDFDASTNDFNNYCDRHVRNDSAVRHSLTHCELTESTESGFNATEVGTTWL